MNAVTRFVAVVFGPHRREGGWLAAPGDADCRWRIVASSERRATVEADRDPPNDEALAPAKARSATSL
jgi:hypothetical protein